MINQQSQPHAASLPIVGNLPGPAVITWPPPLRIGDSLPGHGPTALCNGAALANLVGTSLPITPWRVGEIYTVTVTTTTSSISDSNRHSYSDEGDSDSDDDIKDDEDINDSIIHDTLGSPGSGDGSCQISLSTNNGTSFTVLHSFIGSCVAPPARPDQDQVDTQLSFRLPADTPASEAAILAWSWIPQTSRTPEFHMDCAVVSVGECASTAAAAAFEPKAFVDRPSMFCANVEGCRCTTVVGRATRFPDPGPDVDERVRVWEAAAVEPMGEGCGRGTSAAERHELRRRKSGGSQDSSSMSSAGDSSSRSSSSIDRQPGSSSNLGLIVLFAAFLFAF